MTVSLPEAAQVTRAWNNLYLPVCIDHWVCFQNHVVQVDDPILYSRSLPIATWVWTPGVKLQLLLVGSVDDSPLPMSGTQQVAGTLGRCSPGTSENSCNAVAPSAPFSLTRPHSLWPSPLPHTSVCSTHTSLSSTHLTWQYTPNSAAHTSLSNTCLTQQHTSHLAIHASLSNTHITQQHTPHSATHASLSSTHLTWQYTPHSATHASLSNTCPTQQHMPHSATHASLSSTHLTQQHMPHSAAHASLGNTCLTQQHMPHSATHASLSNTHLTQQHTPHSAAHTSHSNTCLTQQHTPHSATHASLSNTHLTQQHTPHSATHASLSNTHLTQQHTPHSVSHPHNLWPSPLIHIKVCSTHTSHSQSGQAVCLQLNSPCCTGLPDRASLRYRGFIHRGTCEVLHLILCNSFLNPPQCDASLPFWLCLLHVLDAQELFPPNFAVQKR